MRFDDANNEIRRYLLGVKLKMFNIDNIDIDILSLPGENRVCPALSTRSSARNLRFTPLQKCEIKSVFNRSRERKQHGCDFFRLFTDACLRSKHAINAKDKQAVLRTNFSRDVILCRDVEITIPRRRRRRRRCYWSHTTQLHALYAGTVSTISVRAISKEDVAEPI